MKIIADENIPFVKAAFKDFGEVTTLAGRKICQKDLITADILLVRSITKVNSQLLHNTPIKFIASATSGTNHIDNQYLSKNNIAFADALGSNANSVAQYVISAICYWSLSQNINLQGLSIGIIGYGNVGKRLKQLTKLLGLRCYLNDPPLAEQNKSGFYSISKALACDIVSMHVPYSITGKHPTDKLLNKNNIDKLQKNALFINTSRGEVIDEHNLLQYKKNNNKINLVLDVWENEPKINLNTLKQTLIGTPHIAGYSYDAKLKGTEMIYQACCKYLNIHSKWSIKNIGLRNNPALKIMHSKHLDIRESILNAYDINSDNQQLKQLLNNSEQTNTRYFDNLRKNYPKRREWDY